MGCAGEALGDRGGDTARQILVHESHERGAQLVHRLHRGQRSVIAVALPGEQMLERGDQRVVDTSEVVEDQCLVEVACTGDGPGTGVRDALVAERGQRRIENRGLGTNARRVRSSFPAHCRSLSWGTRRPPV
jgi:hypothetical protein